MSRDPNKLYLYKVGSQSCLLHPTCVDGFREDRKTSLIYGPYRLPDGRYAINAEQASIALEFCPYCGYK